jgi:hypothetical protein
LPWVVPVGAVACVVVAAVIGSQGLTVLVAGLPVLLIVAPLALIFIRRRLGVPSEQDQQQVGRLDSLLKKPRDG